MRDIKASNAKPDRTLHDGRQDGLESLEPLDLTKVTSCSALLRGMSKTAFGGRRLGEALDVLLAMVRDPDCVVVGTFSGAMTVAKMGKIICDMIDHGMLDVIVATGALMTHGLSEAAGFVHYKAKPGVSDPELFEMGYNRVYDTLEMEQNLNEVSKVFRDALRDSGSERPWSSERICRAVGKLLAERTDEPGILKSAYLADVPVYIPAFTDCELGLDMASFALVDSRGSTASLPASGKAAGAELPAPFSVEPDYNPFLDLNSYARRAYKAERLGIFTIGGGVPRNWAQQVGPYADFLNYRHGFSLKRVRFQYGVRICPEPVHWGGLSGCTYSEGMSWGKFVPPDEGGRFAEVLADATIAWPLLIKAALEELG